MASRENRLALGRALGRTFTKRARMSREQALERFQTLTQVRFETSAEDPWLNAVLVEADDSGRATGIRQLLVPLETGRPGR